MSLLKRLLSAPLVRAAAGFEDQIAQLYDRAANAVTHAEAKALFAALAKEEREHARRLRQLPASEPDAPGPTTGLSFDIPPIPHDTHAVPEVLEWITRVQQHEQAVADFYDALARKAVLPAVKHTLRSLAEQENRHLQHLQTLRTLLGRGPGDGRTAASS
ncbi:MAG: hypothetical protein JXR37_37345 [Kiritimatiellae bacterium]|nr:hypothetical protein [Kiritimatiellia bacterium]